MPTCTNQGCGQEYDPASSSECTYHPGGPVFHEGLKSWSCCKDDGKSEHKPVLEFESFVKIPGCTKGEHSEKSKPKAPVELQKQNQNKESQVDEVAATTPAAPTPSSTPKPAPAPSAPATWTILHDSASTTIPSSAKCKRRGCGAPWTGEDGAPRSSVPGFKEVKGDKEEWKVDVRGGLDAQEEEEKEEGECRFHPGSPIFHEGSKGYLCCKRRVLDFDDFLRLPGCRRSQHLFVGPAAAEGKEEEKVDCRLDHYQTPMQVHVSAFAKNADKTKSTVTFTPTSLSLDLYLPSNKRVLKTIDLYGPIDPSASSFRILGTKIEITLQKPSATSWPLLEKPKNGKELPKGYALTFGVGGRTGSVGGKEIVMEQGQRL